MVRRVFDFRFLLAVALVWTAAAMANAASVTQQVYVSFDGTLAGSTYTLGPGEIDNSFTFGANGSATISGGIADIPGDVDGTSGFYFSGVDLAVEQGLGSIVGTNWISEAIFSPDVPAAQQPSNPQAANHILDVQGDTFMRYDGFCCGSPKRFDAGYWDGSNEGFAFAPEPPVGTFTHVALVWDAAATTLEAFVAGVSIGTVDQNAFDVSSPNIGYGFFSRFLNRAIDGKLDAVAFSTYAGTFDPSSDFQLPVVPEPSAFVLVAIALWGLAWVRKK